MKRTYLFVVLIVVALVMIALYSNLLKVPADRQHSPEDENQVACTTEAMLCPDGSAVGRGGTNCEFAKCPSMAVGGDVLGQIADMEDLIEIATPEPGNVVVSPLRISGEARGYWFFEASAPVVLTDWDGKIIAESYVTANGEWMTEEKVPFSGTLDFESPYREGDPDFMQRGTLILKNDNPSGLPENSEAVELPIYFKAN